MAAPNYRTSTTALVDALKGLFENRTCTEAQALANATSKPNTIYYTTDTKCVVVGGQIYGRGQQLSSVFRFIPAGQTPGQGEFSDTGVIYVQPDGTNFVLWWYQPSGTWVQTGSIAFDIATSASDISYDLTPTPDLGEGDVQSAIEALDVKVEQLSLDTMGKDESGEYLEDELHEFKGYSEISRGHCIGSYHGTSQSGYHIFIFPSSEGDVWKVEKAAGAGQWEGFWKGGTNYAAITAANHLQSWSVASGTFTAPAGTTLFAVVTNTANEFLTTAWKKTTRPAKTPADIQRQLIELETGCINTSALEVGEVMPYWVAASTIHGIRLEVRKGQVLLLDLVGSATYAPLVFTDEDRIITEIHQTPVYGAFEVPNDGYAYIQKLISHESDNYLYIMGYGGHAKDMVKIMEDTGEVADQKIDDEKVEFIKERFPGQSIAAYILASQTKVAVSNNNDTISFIGSTATNQTARWSKLLVPKGTLIVWQRQKSQSTAIDCLGYSTVSPQNYYETNGTIVGFTAHKLIWYTATTTYTEHHTIMPEDGYIIQCYLGQDSVMNVSTSYDSSILKDYYNKGFADGSAMASIVGLGYNIWDYISGAVNLDGFEYGCNLRRTFDKTHPSGSWKNKYKSNTSLYYFPTIDTSAVTNFSQTFYECTKLKTVGKIDATGSDNTYQTFMNCANLVEIHFEVQSTADILDTFSGCSNLRKVTGLSELNKLSNGSFRNCTKLESVDLSDGVSFRGPYQTFQNCKALKYLPRLGASTASFNGTFYNCSALVRIEEIDFIGATDYGNANYNLWYSYGGTGCTSLRYVLIKNFGYNSGCTAYYGNRTPLWGIANDEVPDARQSLIDSLITYSFDRATAGYSACTITLSANTKALLTDEEIEQITAKGYTIA